MPSAMQLMQPDPVRSPMAKAIPESMKVRTTWIVEIHVATNINGAQEAVARVAEPYPDPAQCPMKGMSLNLIWHTTQ
jgi:hypothetical protein